MKFYASAARLSLAALLLFAAAIPAASQQPSVSTQDLTRMADVIVVAKVAGLKAGWSGDHSKILTTVTLAVNQSLKGGAQPSSVALVTPGGEVGAVGEWYSHMPQFKIDEDVLVFAKKDQHGELRVTGGSDGKMSIQKDERTGLQMVRNGVTLESLKGQIMQSMKAESH